jgi:hypothetical protein
MNGEDTRDHHLVAVFSIAVDGTLGLRILRHLLMLAISLRRFGSDYAC